MNSPSKKNLTDKSNIKINRTTSALDRKDDQYQIRKLKFKNNLPKNLIDRNNSVGYRSELKQRPKRNDEVIDDGFAQYQEDFTAKVEKIDGKVFRVRYRASNSNSNRKSLKQKGELNTNNSLAVINHSKRRDIDAALEIGFQQQVLQDYQSAGQPQPLHRIPIKEKLKAAPTEMPSIQEKRLQPPLIKEPPPKPVQQNTAVENSDNKDHPKKLAEKSP